MLSTKEERDTYNFLLKDIQIRPPLERLRAIQHLREFLDVIGHAEDDDNDLFL